MYLERKFVLLRRIWVSIGTMEKLSSSKQNLGAKTHKKCCCVGVLEAIVIWQLTFSTKAQETNFCSPPSKFLESFVFSTNKRSMKCSKAHIFQTHIVAFILHMLW
jgi:uncharacterized membrane protein YagU involved in acid resistance